VKREKTKSALQFHLHFPIKLDLDGKKMESYLKAIYFELHVS